MKHKYYVYRTVIYTERVEVYAENEYIAKQEAQYTVDSDWESDDIDRDTDFKTPWVAELDEEELVEDLMGVDRECLDDVVETMFDEEVEK